MAGGLETALCRELGIAHPIFSVGFAMSAGPSLVAAVSSAGGCGVLGAGSGAMPIDEVRRRIRRVRELTERPFGLNMIIAGLEHPDADEEDRVFVHERVSLAIDERVPVLVLFWGDPAPFVEDAHRRGVKVFVQVGTLAEAEAAAAAGVDAVIAQGIEGGGHVRGATSIWDLLLAAVEAVQPTEEHRASASSGLSATLDRAQGHGCRGLIGRGDR